MCRPLLLVCIIKDMLKFLICSKPDVNLYLPITRSFVRHFSVGFMGAQWGIGLLCCHFGLPPDLFIFIYYICTCLITARKSGHLQSAYNKYFRIQSNIENPQIKTSKPTHNKPPRWWILEVWQNEKIICINLVCIALLWDDDYLLLFYCIL